MARTRFTVGVICLMVACFLGALLVIAAGLAITTGWERVVLVSDSMAPRLRAGDVIFADPRVEHPVDPGTVVVVRNPAAEGLLTHRVAEVLPDGSYVTRGDANTSPDSTPVPPEAVVGEGQALVPYVGTPAALVDTGRPLQGVGLLLAAGLMMAAARWAWPPAVPGVRAELGSTRSAAVAGATTAVVAAMAVAGLPVTDSVSLATFTRNTTNTGDVLKVITGPRFYLKSSGTGNVASSVTLPLSPAAPTATTLPNYDTDRDSIPGLTVARGGTYDTTDLTKIQTWIVPDGTGSFTLGNPVRVRLWTSLKSLTTGGAEVRMQAYSCKESNGACSAVGTEAVVTRARWSPSGTWTPYEWVLGDLGTFNNKFNIQLRVIVSATSADDVRFAYDTTAYPADIAG